MKQFFPTCLSSENENMYIYIFQCIFLHIKWWGFSKRMNISLLNYIYASDKSFKDFIHFEGWLHYSTFCSTLLSDLYLFPIWDFRVKLSKEFIWSNCWNIIQHFPQTKFPLPWKITKRIIIYYLLQTHHH
jgi:hypothetical protein